jgi:C1A family cysteine protease
MRAFIALAALACVANAYLITPETAEVAFKFESFKSDFAKKYVDEAAETHAFENFQATLNRIAEREVSGVSSRTKWAVTKFADLSTAEFKQLLGYKPSTLSSATRRNVAQPPVLSNPLPATFDWRSKNAVTPVKDQGQCGSCWAFSATESIESMSFLAGNPLVALAPEQIVDCDTVDQGCNGGNTETAFQYVTQAKGLDTEASYPYTAGGGNSGNCAVKPKQFQAKIDNYTYAVQPCGSGPCNNQNETLLMEVLFSKGPLAICVNAEPWQDYSSGVMQSGDCPHGADTLDHCVQLVGYNQPGKYWEVRNSWNTDWGINGYIWLEIGQNVCGVANDANYANALKL